MTSAIPDNKAVTVQIGRFPALWNNSAVFFANLDCIFFGDPDKTKEIIKNVTGFHSYGSRLIPVLGLIFRGGNNLLLLTKEPDKDLLRYFSHELGLTLPDIEIITIPRGCGYGDLVLDHEVKARIIRHPSERIDGYVTDPHLEEMAKILDKDLVNSHAACRDANDKLLLHQFLDQARLPVFDGGEVLFGPDLDYCLAKLKDMGYSRAVVRSSLGASGFGMHIAELGKDSLATIPSTLFSEKVLVQGWIEPGIMGFSDVSSPSVQFFCGSDQITLFDITDQLLSKSSIHEGNLSPPLSISKETGTIEELIRQAELVASWVASTGYHGTGSVDFLVFKKNGKVRVHVCEVNARVTGATYPSLLALHFNPGGAWLMRNMLFGPCMDVKEFLAFLDSKRLLFRPGNKEGIMPLNTIISGACQISKCQLLFLARSSERCLEMIEAFPALLPAECKYDRD